MKFRSLFFLFSSLFWLPMAATAGAEGPRIVIFGMAPDPGASLSSVPLSAAAQIVLRLRDGSFANPAASDDRNASVEKSNVRIYFEILKELRSKGFRLELNLNPTAADFLDTYRAEDVAALLHENHSSGDSESGIVFLKFGGTSLDPAAFQNYRRSHPGKISPGAQLKFIYTKSCYGGLCGDIYGKPLNLARQHLLSEPRSVDWLGSPGLVNQHNTLASARQLRFYLQNIFFNLTFADSSHQCASLF